MSGKQLSFIVGLLMLSLVLVSGPSSATVSAVDISCPGDVMVSVSDITWNWYYRVNGTGPGLPSAVHKADGPAFTWILPGPGTWSMTVEEALDESGPWKVSYYPYSAKCQPLTAGEDGLPAAGPIAPNMLDGRINNDYALDVAAPVAVYCLNGNIDVYKIDAETGAGTRIIRVPQVSGTPEEGNQLLASEQGVSLYWLATGGYQLEAVTFDFKPYSITWEGCDSSTLVHLA